MSSNLRIKKKKKGGKKTLQTTIFELFLIINIFSQPLSDNLSFSTYPNRKNIHIISHGKILHNIIF